MSDATSAPSTQSSVAAVVAAALAAMPARPDALRLVVPAPQITAAEALALEPAGNAERVMPFRWVGSPWSLTGTCLFNAMMTIVTIGVYSFWGRTEIRKRLWSCVRLEGEPLAYHGTGRELFKGFLGAMIIVLLPIFLAGMAMVIIYGQASGGWVLYQAALFAVVYPVLKALATYRARRYRLARTSWRGIRGSMGGSSGEFAFLSWATSLLYPLTLGWIAPWRALYIQRFLAGDTMLGDRSLDMKGSTLRLYVRFGVLWLATVAIGLSALSAIFAVLRPIMDQQSQIDWTRAAPSYGFKVAGIVIASVFVWSLISSFYRSSLYNLTISATTLLPSAKGTEPVANAPRFRLTTTGRSLLWLFVTNQLITYGSLYIFKPIATARTLRYFTERLSIVGNFDPAALRQNPNAARAEGEGLAQAFDFDAI